MDQPNEHLTEDEFLAILGQRPRGKKEPEQNYLARVVTACFEGITEEVWETQLPEWVQNWANQNGTYLSVGHPLVDFDTPVEPPEPDEDEIPPEIQEEPPPIPEDELTPESEEPVIPEEPVPVPQPEEAEPSPEDDPMKMKTKKTLIPLARKKQAGKAPVPARPVPAPTPKVRAPVPGKTPPSAKNQPKAVVRPQPAPAAPPLLNPDGTIKRGRGRPPGSKNRKGTLANPIKLPPPKPKPIQTRGKPELTSRGQARTTEMTAIKFMRKVYIRLWFRNEKMPVTRRAVSDRCAQKGILVPDGSRNTVVYNTLQTLEVLEEMGVKLVLPVKT